MIGRPVLTSRWIGRSMVPWLASAPTCTGVSAYKNSSARSMVILATTSR